MALTANERRHQVIGQRLLERELVTDGLISRRGLYERGPGAMARERRHVCDQLAASFRRENLAGRDQILQDGLRVLRGKKPRHLQQSPTGRRLFEKLRAARRSLEQA